MGVCSTLFLLIMLVLGLRVINFSTIQSGYIVVSVMCIWAVTPCLKGAMLFFDSHAKPEAAARDARGDAFVLFRK